MAARRPVRRIGEDRFALRLEPHVREVIGSLIDELRGAMRAHADGAGETTTTWAGPAGAAADRVARLYPPAFPHDAEAEAAWADLVRPGLDDARARRLERMETTLAAEELDETAASAWLWGLHDLRLVLGAQLAIADDAAPPAAASDADATRRMIF